MDTSTPRARGARAARGTRGTGPGGEGRFLTYASLRARNAELCMCVAYRGLEAAELRGVAKHELAEREEDFQLAVQAERAARETLRALRVSLGEGLAPGPREQEKPAACAGDLRDEGASLDGCQPIPW